MTSNTITQTEEIYLLQKEFDKIIKCKKFTKIFNKFEDQDNPYNFDKIVSYLSKKISFNTLNNPAFSFYLSNNKGKIIVSNINNNFSNYNDYKNNIDFKNISEKSEFLNNLNNVQKTNETNVNLLQEPQLNVIIAQQNNGNTLYYTVQRRKSCEGYILTGFLYDFFNPEPIN
jgi:hypothetical protein